MTEPGIDIEKEAFEVLKDSVNFDGFTPEEIKQEVRRVVDLCLRVQKAERDRCAEIAKDFPLTYMSYAHGMKEHLHELRKRIADKILAPNGEPK